MGPRKLPPAPRRAAVLVEAPGNESLRLRAIAAEAGFHVISASSGHWVRTLARRIARDVILVTPRSGPPGPSEIARRIEEDPETCEIRGSSPRWPSSSPS